MNRSSRRNGIALLVSALLVGCGGHATSTSAAQDEALTALKSLRSSGVLSEAEYQAKVATLQGTGSPGLGDGGSLGENAGTPEAAKALGVPDAGAAGLATDGKEFAGGTPARRAGNPNAYTAAAQNTVRAGVLRADIQKNVIGILMVSRHAPFFGTKLQCILFDIHFFVRQGKRAHLCSAGRMIFPQGMA